MYSILMIFISMVIVPFCMGLLPAFFIDRRKRSPRVIYVSGFVSEMAMFQVISVPIIIFKGDGFDLIVFLYTAVVVIFSLAGFFVSYMDIKNYGSPFRRRIHGGNLSWKLSATKGERLQWVIAVGLIVIQILGIVLLESFDGDDAYYVVQSLLAEETGTLYRIKPYTGLTTSMDLRHALASVPIWIAYLGRITGLHPTIVAHSVLGVFILIVIYLVYYECGRILLKNDRRKLPAFMIFVSLLHIFGNVSIYTNSTFLLTRIWQGKAMLANMVIMIIIWLFLAIFEGERLVREWRIGYWLLLFATCIVATMCSTAGVLLIAMLIGLTGLVMAIREKSIQYLLRLILVCLPLVICAGIYIMM